MNSRNKRVLITGVSGLLGNNLAYFLSGKYEILGIYNSYFYSHPGIKTSQCDLLNKSDFSHIVKDFSPDIIVHTAAMTNVDKCEQYPEEAKKQNIVVTKNIVESIQGMNTQLTYVSTDAVYKGDSGVLTEESPTIPCNVYGQTKLEGEYLALEHPNALILRTNIFGWNVQNKMSLGEWVINKLINKESFNGFQDALFSSIYTGCFAVFFSKLIEDKLSGVFNLSSSNHLSKYDFARKICDRLGLNQKLIKPGYLKDLDVITKRYNDLRISNKKLSHSLNIKLPSAEDSIRFFLEGYVSGL